MYSHYRNMHEYVKGFLHCAWKVKSCLFFKGKTPVYCNNEKIRFLYNKMFSFLTCFCVLTMKRLVGQIVLFFCALHNATSVQTKICDAAGTVGLIFHNRISLIWWVYVVVDDLHLVNKHISLDFKFRLENVNAKNCFYINMLTGLLTCNSSIKISEHKFVSYPYISSKY